MKRLALVLAAALLGTGCIADNTCDRTLTLGWDFETADGAVVGCSRSNNPTIVAVDVFANGQGVGSFNCLDGQGTVFVPGGSNLVTVEGVDSTSAIQYRDEFTIDGVCGDQAIATRPSEGRVSVAYSFSPVNVCVTPPSFIWVNVRDDIAAVTAVDSAAAPELFVCSQPVSFRLASGNYTLLKTEERIPAGGGTYSTVARDCTDYAFAVSAAATTTVSPVLVDSTFACP